MWPRGVSTAPIGWTVERTTLRSAGFAPEKRDPAKPSQNPPYGIYTGRKLVLSDELTSLGLHVLQNRTTIKCFKTFMYHSGNHPTGLVLC
jgi:hypothetical protein